ncbi:hypothetical protein S83_019759, partial [Arachis hypogaea]
KKKGLEEDLKMDRHLYYLVRCCKELSFYCPPRTEHQLQLQGWHKTSNNLELKSLI